MASLHIGIWSFVISVAFAAVYAIFYGLGRAWGGDVGVEKSTARFFPRIVFLAVLGFAAGTFVQSLADYTKECRDTGRPIGMCMLLPLK